MLKPLALLGWVLILGRDVYIVSVTKKSEVLGALVGIRYGVLFHGEPSTAGSDHCTIISY